MRIEKYYLDEEMKKEEAKTASDLSLKLRREEVTVY